MNFNNISFLSEIPSLDYFKTNYPNVKAFFFDMDGTLFNTEPHHAAAFLEMGKKFNISPPFDAQKVHEMLVGRADHMVYEIVKNWNGFPPEWDKETFVSLKNSHLLKILSQSKVDTYFSPLILQLLSNAKQEQFTLGLVTSSEKVITSKLLEIAGLDKFFEFVITRDDCPFHKPDPWPYKKAISLSKISAIEALIFEDSLVGVEAAQKSGANVIQVSWYSR